jgi:hypothetical protein
MPAKPDFSREVLNQPIRSFKKLELMIIGYGKISECVNLVMIKNFVKIREI